MLSAGNDEAVQLSFECFLLREYNEAIREHSEGGSSPTIQIDSLKLASAFPRIVTALFSRPRSTFALLHAASITARAKLSRNVCTTACTEDKASGNILSALAKTWRPARIGIDIYRLACPLSTPGLEDVKSCNVERLVLLRGTVLRSTNIKSRAAERLVQCVDCGYSFLLACGTKEGNVQVPPRCPGQYAASNEHTLDAKPCHGTIFRPFDAVQPFLSDFQKIQVQLQGAPCGGRTVSGSEWRLDETLLGTTDLLTGRSQHEDITVGRTVQVVLSDDMVQTCKPGDDICLSAIFQWEWHRASRRQRAHVKMIYLATAIVVTSEKLSLLQRLNDADVQNFASFWRCHSHGPGNIRNNRNASSISHRLQGRDIILQSVCAGLFQLQTVKLAILLTLVSGVPQTNGCFVSNIRSDCHLLLVGDSGSGKSYLLRHASKLAMRAITVNGAGSTLAGMSAVVPTHGDDKDFLYEYGAFTMANGGICCIDQFHLIGYQARAVVHEAMEQQTISIAKGRTITSIQTRCSIIGAAAAKGIKYETAASITSNTGLAAPILSRFDCIMVLHDVKHSLADRALSSHLIKRHRRVHFPARKAGSCNPSDKDSEALQKFAENITLRTLDLIESGNTSTSKENYPTDGESDDTIAGKWTFDDVRKYISLVRCALDPMLSPDAESLIRGYYQLCRCQMSGQTTRPTIRLLESLVRISQAHAKLVWKNETACQDVVVAVYLSEVPCFGSQEDKNSTVMVGIQTLKDAIKHKEIQLVQQIRATLGPMWWK
uniref:DNA helicase n=1 Tax=Micromonas pusilla TaxID=38833 RepID=A0A7S0IB64_MICPS|mmetsp:Transcript_1449/g.5904  ORF Transcript_1449/g.5904 Transcript_1449/m.5904 type:complete len:772 (+) Transcript_1449:170-2485(+)